MTEENKQMGTGEHRSHRKSKKKRKNKFLKFVGKYKMQIAGVVVFFVLLITLMVVAFRKTPKKDGTYLIDPTGQHTGQTAPEGKPGALSLQAPHFAAEVELPSPAARAWMNSPIAAGANQVLESYRESGQRLDVPAAMELKFDVLSLPKNTSVVSSKVEVWETGNAGSPRSYGLGAKDRSVEIWNLKTGTDYRYQVTVYLSDGTSSGIFGGFRTASGPRLLNIGGLHNVRDFGGWQADDKLLPQGLLYRGSEADGAVVSHYKITEQGLEELVLKLGIRTDMDLRPAGKGGAALGANVAYKAYGMGDDLFDSTGKGAIARVLGDLADRSNYPVYLHDTDGTDSAAVVCYLLGALLGVSEEDLIREYELSALASEDVSRQNLGAMANQLKEYGSQDLGENVENYLLDAGVTAEQIASIREIWLG